MRKANIEINAVVGGIANLPCNVSITSMDDSMRLVLWYRDNVKGGPIYSFDARNTAPEAGKHFADIQTLSNRASFNPTTNPAYLTIRAIKREDMGEYKCRVDFRRSRTLTTI
ncbi:cell adhesion molecule 1-like protein, partial [Dinothrombium tinctorium]